MSRNKHSNARKNRLLSRGLVVAIFLGLSSVSLKSVAQFSSSRSNFLSIYGTSSNQFDNTIAQQSADKTQPANSQKDVDKETRKEEKNLEKEAKRNCQISSDGGNLKKNKKCEPSIYEQMYPGFDFQAEDKKITDELLRELNKDEKLKGRTLAE
jgi:hypothetical protein